MIEQVVIFICLVFFSTLNVQAAEALPDAPSCKEELGPTRSAELVADCLSLSSATHPPCNDYNPCSVIINHLVQSCRLLKHAEAVCQKYTSTPAADI